MSDALRAAYDALNAEADLLELVTNATPEDLHTEFKTKHDRRSGELHDGDRFHWSRALSGFSNSDGGLLVWGIETKKRNGVDVAVDLKAIADVGNFAGRLQKSLLSSTIPVVDDVLVKTLPTSNSGSLSSGFVVCLIPASAKVPHRAMLASREYFKRTIDGFYRLEHFDLQDLFGRRPPALLKFFAQAIKREVVVGIVNEGRGVARAPFLGLAVSFPFVVSEYGVDGNGNTGLPKLVMYRARPSEASFGGPSTMVVHSGIGLAVTRVALPHGYAGPPPDGVIIKFKIAAEDVQLFEGEEIVSVEWS